MNTFTRFCGNSEKVNRVNLRPANFLGSDSYGKPSQMLHDLVSGRSVATQKKKPPENSKDSGTMLWNLYNIEKKQNKSNTNMSFHPCYGSS